FITRFNWELGSAFGFVLLAASSLVVWAGLKLSGQSLSSSLARGS
ncbi:ABC transporter permease, partial [Verminephrobacter sp. Larva24]